MTPPPIPPDLLLSHAEFIRRLARKLLADDALAEDVLQETFVVALEKPPARRTSIRGWLGSVEFGDWVPRLTQDVNLDGLIDIAQSAGANYENYLGNAAVDGDRRDGTNGPSYPFNRIRLAEDTFRKAVETR